MASNLLRRGLGQVCRSLGFDLADGIYHGVEGQQGGSVPCLVVAYRLQHGDVGPFAVCRGAPFSLSILRTVSRSWRSSAAFEPMSCGP